MQPHHESGNSRVNKDAEMVVKVIAAIETNPFTTATPSLINISTGECADATVKDNLRVKEIGLNALSQSLTSHHKKTTIVKLNTFHTQKMKPKKSGGKTSGPGKSNEVTALLRMTQIIASGGELDIADFIGNHECSDLPPSLFQEDGNMRTGTKSSLVKVLKEETKVSTTDLPKDCRKTAVVVDAMCAIRHWSFRRGERFGEIADRYKHLLQSDVPPGTEIIHFCCDRYNGASLKSAEQQQRYPQAKRAKVYEVSEQYAAPDPNDFFAVSSNKANLLSFLCERWCEDEQLGAGHGPTELYLGGGFKEETKSVLLSGGSVTDVPALESTQQEADTRVILHTLYSVQNEGVERVVIHANDTDIITTCLYYGATHLCDLPELWVRAGQNAYLPIHEMVVALGPAQCRAMPFIHSLSGRDTTSYPFFTGKKAWFKSSMRLDIPALEDFGENPCDTITDDLLNQARDLTITVYQSKADHFEGSDLGKLRVFKFLNNKSTLLKLLPPTEDAFRLRVERAALATMIDKNAHIPKPVIPPCTEFGWSVKDGHPVPVPSSKSAWPATMNKTISCGCLQGCKRNCSCSKRAVPCYVGCRCQGLPTKCSRINISESSDSSNSEDELDHS